jgi:hypothetical protein
MVAVHLQRRMHINHIWVARVGVWHILCITTTNTTYARLTRLHIAMSVVSTHYMGECWSPAKSCAS